jgi:hypothetical protein
MIGILMRTFTFLGKDIFLQLYKALIWLHIEYGNAIWHPYWNRQSAAFERVQRRATKLVPEIKDIPYIWRLSSLSLITFFLISGKFTQYELLSKKFILCAAFLLLVVYVTGSRILIIGFIFLFIQRRIRRSFTRMVETN